MQAPTTRPRTRVAQRKLRRMIRHSCPACGSRDTTTLVREPYTSPGPMAYLRGFYLLDDDVVAKWLSGVDFEVKECRHCGMCFQTFYPEADLATELYDRWISPQHSSDDDLRRASIDRYAPLLQEVVALGKYVEKTSGVPACEVKVLDYGMGWGSWLRLARAVGLNAYGYEVSPKRRENAASMGLPCLNDEELSRHRFHIINVEQVLEHVPDPRALLEKLLPLLKEDGILKIGVPNGGSIARLLRSHGTSRLLDRSFFPIVPLEHVNAFTPKSLRMLAQEYGLKVRKAPARNQFSLIFAGSPASLLRSVGRPVVRGLLGAGTSVVLSR